MFLTKKHLSRRMLLRGAGASMALPFLEAMVPAATALAKTAAKPKPYLGFYYLPHGQIMENWTPKAVGRDFEFMRIMEPMAPFRDKLSIVSNLDNKAAVSPATHAITPGTWLGCVAPAKTPAPRSGTTIDQMAAKHIGQDTPLPSLEIATESGGGVAACTGTYGCSHGNTISFSSPTTPLPMESSPRKLFERLFGQGDTPEGRKAVSRDFSSVIDMVLEDAATLQKKLGAPDKVRLANYLDSVREIERRIETAEKQDMSDVDLPDLPAGIPDFNERLNLMFDMAAVAYQTNLTRVISFMMAAEVSNQAYTHLGVTSAFHPLSHHNNAPAKLEQLTQIQRYHMEVFARFLARLAEMPDGDGTVLDHAVFLYGGNMRDSNVHDHIKLPSMVVGGGCGRLQGGRHLMYPDGMPHANLLVTLLERAGVPITQVGDSTGDLTEV